MEELLGLWNNPWVVVTSLCLLQAEARRLAVIREQSGGIMADVDIDLYGDVEQDFTQVRHARPPDAPLYCPACPCT